MNGVPVRIYVLVTNDQDEVLLSNEGLPSADFIAGKDFKENVGELLRGRCSMRGGQIKVAGLLREFGSESRMAVAFWVTGATPSSSAGEWSYQSIAGAKHKLPEFHASLLENCARSRPGVAVL